MDSERNHQTTDNAFEAINAANGSTGFGREKIAGLPSAELVSADLQAHPPEQTPKKRPHPESHLGSGQMVRDVVIGMADGLTVPFALAAGLSGATASTHVIVTAGLAEIAAGSIAMGLGGFLAARGDREHYLSERARELRETEVVPDREKEEIVEIFSGYGIDAATCAPLVQQLSQNRERWVDFMMKFELGLEEPDPQTAWRSATTIAVSYIVGGALPLSPYLLMADAHRALLVSCAVTAVALFLFGLGKGVATGTGKLKTAVQTTLIGGVAAAAAFALAKLVSDAHT